MTADIVIRSEGLGKKYIIGHEIQREKYVALRDVLSSTIRNTWRSTKDLLHGRQVVAGDTTEEFWALKDVNFEISRGDIVGIIGRNGAGKTTLLKILSRITDPTEGRVTIEGRVASLLEVGTGFHPELTGRENIFLNGAILGMTRAEIKQRFDEIVAFAEVERFLDTPVKRYSSGMYIRLAYAVAAHLEPEILVVDEVLAVADIEFQKKCIGKMSSIAKGGRTVLFVSHNMGAVQTLCPRSIYLHDGRIVNEGASPQIVSEYLLDRHGKMAGGERNVVKVKKGLVLDRATCEPNAISSGGTVELEFEFDASQTGAINEAALLLYTNAGIRIGFVDLRESEALPFRYAAGRFAIKGSVAKLFLVEGTYTVGLFVVTDDFCGDLLELTQFSVSAEENIKIAPYPVEHRGVIRLQAKCEFGLQKSI
jgi:ABC-type polysaccharide/polyol phosphate transport system ATPase subunit